MAILRRRPVAIALLGVFALLAGLLNQELCASIDEAGQLAVSERSISYIMTHFREAQNHPLYGILAHAAIGQFPGSPIRPIRLPSFLAGLLIPIIFYFTQRIRSGHGAAILVAMVLVVVDPLRHYGAVGRGYSILVLGVLVLNHLLLTVLRRGGWARAVLYVPVGAATCYAHLWAFPVLAGHGLFLVWELLRRRGRGAVGRRAAVMLAMIGAAVVSGLGLYWPMAGEIRAMVGTREASPMLLPLADAVLQLPRFASWTVAAHLLMVPIVLEGFARLPASRLGTRAVRLHGSVIACVLAGAMVLHPVNFGSRFLLGIVPSVASLIALGLSGYWRGRRGALPVLPRPATWAIGLGLGVLAANATIAHEIPAGAVADRDGIEVGYYYRGLARRVGDPAALVLLAAGAAGLVLRRPGMGRSERRGVALAYIWSAVLIASILPVLLGPSFSKPLFEVHMVAMAAVLLAAWEHRFDDRYLHAMRFGFLAIGAIALVWQVGLTVPRYTRWTVLGVASYLPPVLILLPIARTTGPAFAAADDA